MLRMITPIVLLVALVAASVWSDRPLPPADLTIVERAEVNSMDPAQMSWNQDFRLGRAVFEGLLRPDVYAADQRAEPAAAESLPEVSADGLRYTFRIRSHARWSNSEPVTASDFVYAWRRMLLPDSAADYSQSLTVIRGATEWAARRTAALEAYRTRPGSIAEATRLYQDALDDFSRSVGLFTPDQRTLIIELERPVPYFLDLVSFVPFFPVHAKSVSAYESVDPGTGRVRWASDWTRPPNLVSNGPYRLTLWRFKRDMRLERNEYYWDPALPKSKTVSILNIADANTMVMSFRAGAVDWTTDVVVPYRADMLASKMRYRESHADVASALGLGIDAASIELDAKLPADGANTIHAFPSFGTYFLNLYCGKELSNGRPNPLARAGVRRALARAVDKDEIVREIRRSGERPAGSLIPPGSIGGYASPIGLGLDYEEARRELAAAGFPGGAGVPVIEYLYGRDSGHDLIAQAVKRTWERELGLSIELAQVESKVFSERVQNGRYMVSRASWFGDYGDPTTFLDLSRRGNNNNDRKFESDEYESLMAASDNERNPAQRLSLLHQAERLIVEREVPLIPVFHYTQVYLFDATRLSGLTAHPRQTQHLFLLERSPSR